MNLTIHTSRIFRRLLPALACLIGLGGLACMHRPAPQVPLVVPQLTEAWSPALRIAEQEHELGFCLIQDRLERWHLILGAEGQPGEVSRMPHAISDRIGQPFRPINPIDPAVSPQPTRTTAPFALSKDSSLALLYYDHDDGVSPPALRLMQSETALMEPWVPFEGKGLQGKNIVSEDLGARDVCILPDLRSGKYLMYSTDSAQHKRILCRESNDLIKWSEPRVVLTAPAEDPAVEAPFVVIRQGLYYLFTSGLDYATTSIYVSKDPLSFGDATADRLTTLPGHAAKVINIGEDYYIACAAIASSPGSGPRAYDLKGVYLQKMEWGDAETVLPQEAFAAQQARLKFKKK